MNEKSIDIGDLVEYLFDKNAVFGLSLPFPERFSISLEERPTASINYQMAELTGSERRELKRLFGPFEKDKYSGAIQRPWDKRDLPGDPEEALFGSGLKLQVTIQGVYECKTVCVAQDHETAMGEQELVG